MPTATPVARAGSVLAAAALIGGLVSCAPEPLKIVAPTMAPDQSISEACAISGAEVDRITVETEQALRERLEQAGNDIAAGRLPTVEPFTSSIDDAIAEVEQQVSNTEVLAALEQLRGALQGFGELEQPESLLGAAGYLSSLTAQITEFANAGARLQQLCVSEDPGAASPEASPAPTE